MKSLNVEEAVELFQTPPGKGRQRKRIHFHFERTKGGKTWTAWCAGKCHWYECHPSERTKPCLDAVTGGALKCPLCAKKQIPVVMGYQPLFRESDAKPCFVIVYEVCRDQVDALRFRHPVIVGRGEGKNDPVWVQKFPGTKELWRSSIEELMQPADLMQSLLSCWKVPELTEWVGEHNIRYIIGRYCCDQLNSPILDP